MSAAAAALPGLALGLSLIVAVGAQNLFVLRQGLRREHVGVVVVVSTASDVLLIGAGVAGAGQLVAEQPEVEAALRLGGAAFLAVCAVLAARRVWRPAALAVADLGTATPLLAVLGTCLAVTWLNPHAYVDTVLLLGGTATAYGDARWWFGLGAVLASAAWFTALGFGARALRPVFSRPSSWRVLDGSTAVVMAALAVSLVLG